MCDRHRDAKSLVAAARRLPSSSAMEPASGLELAVQHVETSALTGSLGDQCQQLAGFQIKSMPATALTPPNACGPHASRVTHPPCRAARAARNAFLRVADDAAWKRHYQRYYDHTDDQAPVVGPGGEEHLQRPVDSGADDRSGQRLHTAEQTMTRPSTDNGMASTSGNTRLSRRCRGAAHAHDPGQDEASSWWPTRLIPIASALSGESRHARSPMPNGAKTNCRIIIMPVPATPRVT